ncbi:hypothetical protein Daesc_000389 [Daldinia eschscholtzii]|uniref:RRM domain-containing protein n=1 Tax=Daldinia eschscholtzii TaxID=292717 RepID=A0AAX6MZJ6_9PEZI
MAWILLPLPSRPPTSLPRASRNAIDLRSMPTVFDRQPEMIRETWIQSGFMINSMIPALAIARDTRDDDLLLTDFKTRGTKVKVENLHYELTEDDLDGLFNKIGPVVKLELLYDRAGRSEGTAFVTYENRDDAMEAIKQYDDANAKGQPIRLSIVSSAPRRNPFDTAHMPGRSLAERITRPRSLSPRRYPERERGVDRYVPGGGSRSRSPLPRRRGGRRPGARRDGREGREGREGGGTPNGRERVGRDGRPKKTQEELDAEMADYFNPGSNNEAAPATETTSASAPAGDDVDMIE